MGILKGGESMALLRRREEWNPLKDLLEIQEEINRLFDTSLAKWPFTKKKGEIPAVDVYEDKDNIVVEADIPGVDPKDIEINLENDTLTLRGKKEEKKEEKKGDYYCMERFYGEFHRSIQIPSKVDTSKIKATYKKGVLKNALPKKEEEKEKGIKIEIEE